MADGDTTEGSDDVTELVDANGLVKLFANRVRARILVTLMYADEPVTPAEIADAAGIRQSPVVEAMEPLSRFDVVERTETAEAGVFRYRLDEDDELTEAVRRVAELATDRFHSG